MKRGTGRLGIKELARHLNLSVSTVSRALNGYDDVRRETRRRVEQAAQDLGYSPHHAAATLRGQSTQTVTFMLSSPWTKFADPFFLGLLDGVEMALQANGFDLQVVMARGHEREMDIILRTVERRRSDAIIFARTRPEDERVEYLKRISFPFATLGRCNDPDFDWVDLDHSQTAWEATTRLASLGHQRIALLNTPMRYSYSHHALSGYRQALKECELPEHESLIQECTLAQGSGMGAMKQLLAQSQRPSAVVCGNDVIAVGAMDAIRRLGLTPGVEVSVIGCDDIPVASYSSPPLTTFGIDLESVGLTLGRVVLDRLNGKPRAPQNILQNMELISRGTDRPAPR